MKLIVLLQGFTEVSAQPMIDKINAAGITDTPMLVKPILPGQVHFTNGEGDLQKAFDLIEKQLCKIKKVEFKIQPTSKVASLVMDVEGDEAFLTHLEQVAELAVYPIAIIDVEMIDQMPVPTCNNIIGFGLRYTFEHMSSIVFESFGSAAIPKDIWALLNLEYPEPLAEGEEVYLPHVVAWDRKAEGAVVYEPVDNFTYNLAGVIKNLVQGSEITEKDIKHSVTLLSLYL